MKTRPPVTQVTVRGARLRQTAFAIRLCYSVEQACEATGLGRSSIFVAVKKGRLKARESASRTLIRAADLQAFIDRLPERAV
jgi:excisionase family DNA binding protein